MHKIASDRLAMTGLTSLLPLIGGFASLVTADALWLLLSAAVAGVCLLAILFLPAANEDDAAMASLVTGDMSDPKQRGPVIRSTLLVVPHTVAFFLLVAADITADAERPLVMPGLLGDETVLFAVFVATGALCAWDMTRFARRDPFLASIYQQGLAKGGALFAAVTLLWQLTYETFGIVPPRFVFLYAVAACAFAGFVYGNDAFKRAAA